MTESDKPFDSAAVVAEIKHEVERRRAAGEYPRGLEQQLRVDLSIDSQPGPPEILAVVRSSQPLHSDRSVGRLIVAGKKVVRRLLAWYVAPIADEQTRFNLAILTEVRRLEARLRRLETPLVGLPLPKAVVEKLAVDLRRTQEIRIAGGADDDLSALRAALPDAIIEPATMDWLEQPTAPAHAFIFLGALNRMSARELIGGLALAGAAIVPEGEVIAVCPDPDGNRSLTEVDPSMQRWLSPKAVEALCKTAGLVPGSPRDWGSWFTVSCRTSARP